MVLFILIIADTDLVQIQRTGLQGVTFEVEKVFRKGVKLLDQTHAIDQNETLGRARSVQFEVDNELLLYDVVLDIVYDWHDQS